MNVLSEKLNRAMTLYNDLLEGLPHAALESKLANLPSNKIGQQLWCVIGARESYLNAIQQSAWKGFSCSVKFAESGEFSKIAPGLLNSQSAVAKFLTAQRDLSDAQRSLLVDLLEHEVQHHGQLIRYLYGLRLNLPASWKARYHL